MQASRSRTLFGSLLVAIGFGVGPPVTRAADVITTNLYGPVYPAALPEGVEWTSYGDNEEIGKAGVRWTFRDIGMADSTNRTLWWGSVSNALSFFTKSYESYPGQVLTYDATNSALSNGIAQWRGKTMLANIPIDTRFTMTFDGDTDPRWGKALSFYGTNKVLIPDFGSVMPTNEVTVEAWIRLRTPTEWPVIFCLNPDRATNRFLAHVGSTYGPNVFWDFGDITQTGRYAYNSGLEPGTWQHFAFVASKSGNYMKVFRNGVEEGSVARCDDFIRGTYALELGLAFLGELDDFRVWSVARTPAEILQNYDHPLTGTEKNLLGYWKFDEAGGAAIADATTNHRDGTLTNGQFRVVSLIPNGHALSLNGENEYAETVNMRNYFTDESITIETWFNPGGPGVLVHEHGPEGWGWSVLEVMRDGEVRTRVYPMNGPTVLLGKVEFGTWNHAVLRYNRTTQILDGFLNGAKCAAPYSIDRTVPWESNGSWGIWFAFGWGGYSNMGDGGFYQGKIDEMRIWNVARTDAQILQNYANRLTGSEANLVGYWRFEEAAGFTAYDSTPHRLHAGTSGRYVWADNIDQVPPRPREPLSLIDVRTLSFPTNIGAVLQVTNPFTVKLQFTAGTNGPDGVFYPAYDFYDALRASLYIVDGNKIYSEAAGAFYYGYKPVITNAPVSVGVNAGTNVTFSVGAIGLRPLTYEWLKDNAIYTNGPVPLLSLKDVQYNATFGVVVKSPAGKVASDLFSLLVTNKLSGEIKPPPGVDTNQAPQWTPLGGAYWTGTRLYVNNMDGELTVTWFDTNGTATVNHLYISQVSATLFQVGDEIPRPNVASPLLGEPASVPREAVYWHKATQKLYAAAPASAVVTWKFQNGQNVDQFIQSAWPPEDSRYQLYVSGSPPVNLSNMWANGAALVLGSDGTLDLDMQEVNLSRAFRAPRPGSLAPGIGKSLLLLCPGNPDESTNIYFQFVKAVAWHDTNYLHDHAPAVIGEAITNHFGYHTSTEIPPHLPNRLSPYCERFFNPQQMGSRNITLIPVNRDRTDTTDDDMVAVFYAAGTNLWSVGTKSALSSSIAWPHKAVRYDCTWPEDAPTMVIASENGSGPVQLENWDVYVQNDTNQPGFNPNDEHALKLAARGSTPSLRLGATRLMVLEGGTAEVPVLLSSAPLAPVFVSVLSQPGASQNLSVSPTNLVFWPSNWSAPQTLTFHAAPDTDATNSVTAFTLHGAAGLFSDARIYVEEADTTWPRLMVDTLACSMPEGGTRRISVRLTQQPDANVTVKLQPNAGGELAPKVQETDGLTFTVDDWATNKQFTLVAEQDSNAADERYAFTLRASGELSETREVTIDVADSARGPYAVYPLRDDLGDPFGSPGSVTSEAYVLITYTLPNGSGGVKVFRVVAEDTTYRLRYTNATAGVRIQPPYPLSEGLVSWPQSYGASGPWWRDRKNQIWAKAAGNDGGSAAIPMRFFYGFASNYFYFPDHVARSNGTPVPWLDRRTGGAPGVPADYTYTVWWPKGVNDLLPGETLLNAKNGLPEIAGQTSVAILYQQAEANGNGRSVEIIDPTWIYTCTNISKLPGDVITAVNPIDSKTYFPALPPHLRSRVWFEDGPPAKLRFKGEFRKESGVNEPVGYLLLNVITDRDRAYLAGLSQDPEFRNAINAMADMADTAKLVGPNDLFESLALTAGLAKGEGYVTLAFNNITNAFLPADRGTEVILSVIKVNCPLYTGDTRVVYSDDPFDENVVLRHTGDFAGRADHYRFEWQYCKGFAKPETNAAWVAVKTAPDSGDGALDILVPGPDGSNLRTLVEGWYRCRYRSLDADNPCGPGWSAWTDPALVEGWTKRVAKKINPFDQRFNDLLSQQVNTLVNMMSQAGPRWTGDVPFNVAALENKGLIEIYESILNRGVKLSLEATPAIESDRDASRSLLTIARRLSDLYMVLGNEAYADSCDPTIGYGTEDGQYGSFASSMYCFENVVGSLIEEELSLLRGLDDSNGRDTRVYPTYNRLIWNFTRDMTGGSVAYALNYNIRDTSGAVSNSISEETARRLYPQGHGDAWGHYLMATKNFYRLLRNPNFVWSSDIEYVTVQGQFVPVSYYDERRFAQAAAAKARAGAEIVGLTYRGAYLDDPGKQWQGYLDNNTNRAWGVSEWASRAGQAALFDWVTCNALLPAASTNTGIARVDRTTVSELREVAAEFENIQQEMDKADTGLNPLGLAKNVLPFDMEPQGIVAGKTQFEQVYDRAVTAMNNAIAVFNHATRCTQMLRQQSDSIATFQQNVADREADFTNRLIEVFGMPYSDDIGPGGRYPTGYKGPDIHHYMLTDYSEITGESTGQAVPFTVTYKEMDVADDGSLAEQMTPVTYYLANDGTVVKNPLWRGQRLAPGEIQTAHSDLLQAKARFDRALREYDNLIEEIETQAAVLETVHRLNSAEIFLMNTEKSTQDTLNKSIKSARSRQELWSAASRAALMMANALAEALPKSVGFSVDATSVARSAIMVVGAGVSETLMYKANREAAAELDLQQAKEMFQAQQNINVTTIRQEQDVLSRVAQLQQLVRQEVLLRTEVYTQQEAMQQIAGRYRAALARGQRLLEDLLRFRQQTAAQVQQARYKDMAFRIFRNEALQKYRAQFDLAAMYVYLAAKAYDYETNLRPGDSAGPGAAFISQIVRARTIGRVESGLPQTGTEGDGGLADVMARMSGNFSVLKPQLGLNNPQETALSFSLRKEFLRIVPGASSAQWREALAGFRVADLNKVPEFMQHCLFESDRPEPGLVIPLPTTVNKDMNYFGWPYGPADNKFNETASSIKIYSVGVSFSNYRITGSGGMANTPYVYFVPVGNDILRCPRGSSAETNRFTRVYRVMDQWLPVPFDLGGSDGAAKLSSPDYIPAFALGQGQEFMGSIRAFPAFRTWHDSLSGQNEGDPQFNTTTLISRSVWNTKWLLVIPASSLGSDYDESLDRFIYGGLNSSTGQRDNNGVSDIRLRIKAYWYAGR